LRDVRGRIPRKPRRVPSFRRRVKLWGKAGASGAWPSTKKKEPNGWTTVNTKSPVFGTPSAGSYNPATGLWTGLSLAKGQSVSINEYFRLVT
jgi:hypothetical protein